MVSASISVVAGYLSIASWLGAQLPQTITNYKLQSVDGLSLTFLFNWFMGDGCNLIGCILTHQLPFQTILAIYFVFIDACLLGQYFYYGGHKSKKKSGKSVADFDEEAVVVDGEEGAPSMASPLLGPSREGDDLLTRSYASISTIGARAGSKSRTRSGSGARISGLSSQSQRSLARYQAVERIANNVASAVEELNDQLYRGQVVGDKDRIGDAGMDEEVNGAMLASFYSERSVASRGSGNGSERTTIKRSGRKDKHVSWTAHPALASASTSASAARTMPMRSRSMDRHPALVSPTREEEDEAAESVGSQTPTVPTMSQSQIIGPSSPRQQEGGTYHPRRDRPSFSQSISHTLARSRPRRSYTSGSGGAGTISTSASIVFMGVWGLVGFGNWGWGLGLGSSFPSFSGSKSVTTSSRSSIPPAFIPTSQRGMVLSPPPSPSLGSLPDDLVDYSYPSNLWSRYGFEFNFSFATHPPLPRPLLFFSSSPSLPPLITDVEDPLSSMILSSTLTEPSMPSIPYAAPNPAIGQGRRREKKKRDGPLTPQPPSPDHPKVDKERIVGRISAWICTTFYLTCRLPQIWKNFMRKSCQGLSPFLFLFAFLGNVFYVTSILSSPEAKGPGATAFLLESLPYLIGSGGVLSFDIIILTQAYLYRGRKPRRLHPTGSVGGGIHPVRSYGSFIATGPPGSTGAGGRGRRLSQSGRSRSSFSTTTGLSRSRTRET